MTYQLEIVRETLRLTSLISILLLIPIFYFLLKYKDLYVSELGKQAIDEKKDLLKFAVAIGMFGFLLFLGCEIMEALELLGKLPPALEEVHHFSKVPQIISMITAQAVLLSVAVRLKRGESRSGA